MAPISLLNHLLNFAAPALFVALLAVLASRLLWNKQASALAWYWQIAINLIACLMVLMMGLWLYGNDGKMTTYTALVFCGATTHWLLMKGWAKT
jgi:hypothetical protein